MRGLRHGYGVRTSAPYGVATHFRGQHGNMRGSESSLNQTAGNPVGSKAIGGAGVVAVAARASLQDRVAHQRATWGGGKSGAKGGGKRPFLAIQDRPACKAG